jgi:4-aminobutyrate aminotransferase
LDRDAKTPAIDEADRIMYACLEMGLSFKVSHGSFLTLTPPLTIEEAELDSALAILEKAFKNLLTT